MAVRRLPHHTTSPLVARTLGVYAQDAQVFLRRWGKTRYTRPALLTEWLTLLPGRATLVDLGCGAAQDARELAMRGHRVIGLDRTPALLRFASSRTPRIPLVLADLRALPLRPAQCDGVWAAASLIHLPKRAAAQVLIELRQVLKPDGVLAVTLTHGTKSGVKQTGWMPGRYFARWTKAELERMLGRTGWTVVALRVVSNQERKGRWLNVMAKPA
jgi:SAM-dependent methyltransferase